MNLEEELEKAIRLIVKHSLPVNVTEGIVLRVDKEKRTCDVDRDDLADLTGVRLNSILEAGGDVITVYPQQGSKVLCVLIGNDPSDAYLLSANSIEEVSGQIGEMKLKWNKDGVISNDGENGGLPISKNIVTRLNVVEKDLNTLKGVIKDWIVFPQDGGAALKAAAANWFANEIEETKDVDIENTKIKH